MIYKNNSACFKIKEEMKMTKMKNFELFDELIQADRVKASALWA